MRLSLDSMCSCASLLTGYVPMLYEESTSSLGEPLEELMENQGTVAQIWDHHPTASLWMSILSFCRHSQLT